MPPHLYAAIKLVHLLGMALWFVAPLSIASDARRTLQQGKPHTELLVPRLERSVGIATVGALLTIASGFGLIFAVGGFAKVPPTIHAGLGLAFVALAVELLALRPALSRLGEELSSKESAPTPANLGKLAMLTGIGHLLKAVILVLMVFRA